MLVGQQQKIEPASANLMVKKLPACAEAMPDLLRAWHQLSIHRSA